MLTDGGVNTNLTVLAGDASGYTISVGNGSDQINVGNGNNTLTIGNGNSQLVVGSGNNTITVGDGNDTITIQGGTESSFNEFDGDNGTYTIIDSGDASVGVQLNTGFASLSPNGDGSYTLQAVDLSQGINTTTANSNGDFTISSQGLQYSQYSPSGLEYKLSFGASAHITITPSTTPPLTVSLPASFNGIGAIYDPLTIATAAGGVAPYQYSVSAPSVGLNTDSFTFAPTALGSYTVTAAVTDNNGNTSSAIVHLTVDEIDLSQFSGQGDAYTIQLDFTNTQQVALTDTTTHNATVHYTLNGLTSLEILGSNAADTFNANAITGSTYIGEANQHNVLSYQSDTADALTFIYDGSTQSGTVNNGTVSDTIQNFQTFSGNGANDNFNLTNISNDIFNTYGGTNTFTFTLANGLTTDGGGNIFNLYDGGDDTFQNLNNTVGDTIVMHSGYAITLVGDGKVTLEDNGEQNPLTGQNIYLENGDYTIILGMDGGGNTFYLENNSDNTITLVGLNPAVADIINMDTPNDTVSLVGGGDVVLQNQDSGLAFTGQTIQLNDGAYNITVNNDGGYNAFNLTSTSAGSVDTFTGVSGDLFNLYNGTNAYYTIEINGIGGDTFTNVTDDLFNLTNGSSATNFALTLQHDGGGNTFNITGGGSDTFENLNSGVTGDIVNLNGSNPYAITLVGGGTVAFENIDAAPLSNDTFQLTGNYTLGINDDGGNNTFNVNGGGIDTFTNLNNLYNATGDTVNLDNNNYTIGLSSNVINDTINGGSGVNTIQFLGSAFGNDTIDGGGSGNNTVDFSQFSAPSNEVLNVNLVNGAAYLTNNGAQVGSSDALSDFTNVIGSNNAPAGEIITTNTLSSTINAGSSSLNGSPTYNNTVNLSDLGNTIDLTNNIPNWSNINNLTLGSNQLLNINPLDAQTISPNNTVMITAASGSSDSVNTSAEGWSEIAGMGVGSGPISINGDLYDTYTGTVNGATETLLLDENITVSNSATSLIVSVPSAFNGMGAIFDNVTAAAVSGGTSPYAYSISAVGIGGNANSFQTSSFTFIPPALGDYSVTATATDNNNNTRDVTVNLNVNEIDLSQSTDNYTVNLDFTNQNQVTLTDTTTHAGSVYALNGLTSVAIIGSNAADAFNVNAVTGSTYSGAAGQNNVLSYQNDAPGSGNNDTLAFTYNGTTQSGTVSNGINSDTIDNIQTFSANSENDTFTLTNVSNDIFNVYGLNNTFTFTLSNGTTTDGGGNTFNLNQTDGPSSTTNIFNGVAGDIFNISSYGTVLLTNDGGNNIFNLNTSIAGTAIFENLNSPLGDVVYNNAAWISNNIALAFLGGGSLALGVNGGGDGFNSQIVFLDDGSYNISLIRESQYNTYNIGLNSMPNSIATDTFSATGISTFNLYNGDNTLVLNSTYADTINVYNGNDNIALNDANSDTINLLSSGGNDTFQSASYGTIQLNNSSYTIGLSSNVINDTVHGGSGVNTIQFLGSAFGNDTIDGGGSGNNTVDFSQFSTPSNDVLNIDLYNNDAYLTNNGTLVGSTDTLLNFNNVIGANNTSEVITINSTEYSHNSPITGGSGAQTTLNLSDIGSDIIASKLSLNWTDIGNLTLGQNQALEISASNVQLIAPHNTLMISANSGSSASIITTGGWNESTGTGETVTVNGHTYDTYTAMIGPTTETLLIDENITNHNRTIS